MYQFCPKKHLWDVWGGGLGVLLFGISVKMEIIDFPRQEVMKNCWKIQLLSKNV